MAETDSFSISAFITNLGKYNEGELLGEWVDFPIDKDSFQQMLNRIGIGSFDESGHPYEEIFISYSIKNSDLKLKYFLMF